MVKCPTRRLTSEEVSVLHKWDMHIAGRRHYILFEVTRYVQKSTSFFKTNLSPNVV